MAKKQVYDGITYFPKKQCQGIPCELCGKAVRNNEIAYAIGNANSERYCCKRCIRDLHQKHQKELQQSKFEFSEEDVLYIGEVSSHGCIKATNDYRQRIAVFRNNRTHTSLTINECLKCGKYFLDCKQYEHNISVLMNYSLIRLKDGKKLPLIAQIDPEDISPFQFQKQQSHIPSSVKHAAFRPYQGGRFSGK